MSHFTKCELKMTNLAALKKALADLQLQFQDGTETQGVTVISVVSAMLRRMLDEQVFALGPPSH